ncbi:MAG: hypothetical protein QOH48_806 [Actinomycetota bacterium]|jgi:hypothetical protein|nr:hypothetical protein [Actinomycetota bacterium]
MTIIRKALLGALIPTLVIAGAATAQAKVKFYSVQYESPGVDNGTNKSLNGEYATIRNYGTRTKNLRGWKLVDKRDTQRSIVYKFGRFRLRPGRSVRIHTGRGSNTRTDRYWGRSGLNGYVWSDNHDTAYLKKRSGRLADSCSWISATNQTSPPKMC